MNRKKKRNEEGTGLVISFWGCEKEKEKEKEKGEESERRDDIFDY